MSEPEIRQVAPGCASDLPMPDQGALLDWLSDETLFSLASRQHCFWGYTVSWRTAQELFGTRHGGCQHDFPNCVDSLVTHTRGVWGTAEQLARERTLLRYYSPFISSENTTDAIAAMRSPSVAHLKFRLGLLTSRFRANHPLKACISCMRENYESSGWVWWHLRQQYPGVWVCLRHYEPLCICSVKSTGVHRFLWTLPDENFLDCRWALHLGEALERQKALSELVVSLVDGAADGALQHSSVRLTLRRRMKERGWLTQSGSLRLSCAAPEYLNYCDGLRANPELAMLPRDEQEAALHLGRLMRPPRCGTHPLRLLLAIGWLFNGAKDYLGEHGKRPAAPLCEREQIEPGSGCLSDMTHKERLLNLVQQGTSPTAAASVVGISVGTALAWTARAGISVHRRPKRLVPELRQKMEATLHQGLAKEEVAKQHGVPLSSVTYLLRMDVRLQESWHTARFTRVQREERKIWSELRVQNAGVHTKMLRESVPRTFAWLYRNDRKWLLEHCPPRGHPQKTRRASSIRHDESDTAVAAAIGLAVEQLEAQRGRVRLWQLYQLVPALKPKLSSLDRWPRTKAALQAALPATRRNREAEGSSGA